MTFFARLFLMLLIKLAMKCLLKWAGIVLVTLLALGVWFFVVRVRQFKEELRPKVALEQYEEIAGLRRDGSEY